MKTFTLIAVLCAALCLGLASKAHAQPSPGMSAPGAGTPVLTDDQKKAADDAASREASILRATYSGLGYAGAGIGAGLAILGLGVGIGKIGGSAVEAIARQPEAVDKIQPNMLLAAALIEGAGFFALVITLLVILLK